VALGQIFFLLLVFSGAYEWIQLWYDVEPFFYGVGCILTFQLIRSMFQETKRIPPAFLYTSCFVLPFFNPAQVFQTTRFVTSFECASIESNVWPYIIGFFISTLFFSTFFGLLLSTLLQKYIQRANKAIVFIIASFVITATSQYTWRVFLQYPVDSLGGNSMQRTFQQFDTNTRQRDKNLAVRRHVPIERFLETRALSDRPGLTPAQQEEAALRYKTHFLNRLFSFWDEKRIRFRTQTNQYRTPEQIDRLQQISERIQSRTRILSPLNGGASQSQPEMRANKQKGKAQYSYVRTQTTPNNSSS
jgi:hypothetical protein